MILKESVFFLLIVSPLFVYLFVFLSLFYGQFILKYIFFFVFFFSIEDKSGYPRN